MEPNGRYVGYRTILFISSVHMYTAFNKMDRWTRIRVKWHLNSGYIYYKYDRLKRWSNSTVILY